MFSGIINKGSPQVDVVETVSGVWNEYDSAGWHIVKTPFFLVMEKVCDAGQSAMPFTFDTPVPAVLHGSSGVARSILVKPGSTAIEVPEGGLVSIQVFGDMAKPTATR